MNSGNSNGKTGAVIYCRVCRVSTTKQADNYSLETQEKACRALCQPERLNVLAVFSAAESAKTLDRAQFQKMEGFCIANRRQVVQEALFPTGLVVSSEGFGTPEVRLFLFNLRQEQEEE